MSDSTTDKGGVLDTLKQLLAAANPGLVTKQEIEQLEAKLAELEKLVDELEARLAAKRAGGAEDR